jgi:hypothetical protein
MGISVSVAKYKKAATSEERKFAPHELPPTTAATHDDGISPASTPGRPISQPDTRIPAKRSGVICFANVQVESTQADSSSRRYQRAIIQMRSASSATVRCQWMR